MYQAQYTIELLFRKSECCFSVTHCGYQSIRQIYNLYMLILQLTFQRLLKMTSGSNNVVEDLGENSGNRTLYPNMSCEQLRAFSPTPDVFGYLDDCRSQSFTTVHFSNRNLMSDVQCVTAKEGQGLAALPPLRIGQSPIQQKRPLAIVAPLRQSKPNTYEILLEQSLPFAETYNVAFRTPTLLPWLNRGFLQCYLLDDILRL